MMDQIRAGGSAILIGVGMLAAGCVTPPMGPTVAVFPAANKPFTVFQDDQAICKSYADQQIAGRGETATNRALGAAAVGTVLGTAVGAATGSGRGTTVGAATGAVVGTAVGAGMASRAQSQIQQQYDIAFSQCMYARGNQVPGFLPPSAPPPPPPTG
jgi:uncharacterized protein YcfJ